MIRSDYVCGAFRHQSTGIVATLFYVIITGIRKRIKTDEENHVTIVITQTGYM